MRWWLALVFLARFAFAAGTAADVARAIRENSFDRDECYRVRDLTFAKEDIRLYLNDGHLIFSKPVAGRRIAAVFAADVEGGDGEVILLPPDRAERRSLAVYTDSPNLDEHFRAVVMLFTGDDYDAIKAQLPANPANKKTPEVGALLDEEWTPVLRNLGESFQTRLVLDLIGGPAGKPGLFAALFNGNKLGSFDIVYDPHNKEQITAGRMTNRDNRLYYDTWTAFQSRGSRNQPAPPDDITRLAGYSIQATVNPDLSINAVTRVKVTPSVEGMAVVPFDIAPQMAVTQVSVDGHAAEVLQSDSLRSNALRGGIGFFLVVPTEPLHRGREYEFEFHHNGKVILDAGGKVFYVTARGNWYPTAGIQFTTFDLTFRYPRDLDLVTPGDVLEDRTESEWRTTHRRVSSSVRMAGFNLGHYDHARVERAGLTVDVCANRSLERALQPAPEPMTSIQTSHPSLPIAVPSPPPDPRERMHILANEVASAMEFMASRFGPPALPHLTVSPIPGTFGQGFPGLIYLSTRAYLKSPTGTRNAASPTDELFFEDLLQAHEVAHQWWGNRVTASSYRDYWLMEALANYTALLYLEKTKGSHSTELMLDSYRAALLRKGEGDPTVEATGPIVLGSRLVDSREPAAWRTITYGKGTWILQMLRRRMGDERFQAMLIETLKTYQDKEISTEQFRAAAAQFMPPKSDDPKLESFFDEWVYGTGIPALKLTYVVRGAAPALRLVGTLTQADVDPEFSVAVPVEIQVARGQTITQWVRTGGGGPVTFTVPLKQAPLKVSLDPHYGILRKQ